MFEVRDHTKLKNRESRIWEIGGQPLGGGWPTHRLVYALPAALLVLGVATLLGSILNQPAISGFGSLVALIVAAVVFWLVGHYQNTSGIKMHQAMLVWVHYLFVQSKSVNTTGRKRPPSHMHWQVIMWEPNDPDWHDTFTIFRDHYNTVAATKPAATGKTTKISKRGTSRKRKETR